MAEAGCEAWYPADALAVMGLVEILRHLPRCCGCVATCSDASQPPRPTHSSASIRPSSTARRGRAASPRRAHGAVREPAGVGVAPGPGAQHRAGRRPRAVRAAFETAFYAAHDVRAVFVGHPLADRIPLESDAVAARAALGLPGGGQLVAVLPGSRRGEVARLAHPSRRRLPGCARDARSRVRGADGQSRRPAGIRTGAGAARAGRSGHAR